VSLATQINEKIFHIINLYIHSLRGESKKLNVQNTITRSKEYGKANEKTHNVRLILAPLKKNYD
jgi:hypothetical protein